MYSYDQPAGQFPPHQRVAHYATQSGYQPPYEHPSSTYSHQPSTHRGPRHSIPTASSGFVPLPPSSDAAGFNSSLGYSAHHSTSQPIYPLQNATPTSVDAYLPPLPSNSFVPYQSFPQSQSFHYIPSHSTTPIPQSYTPAPPAAQPYQGYLPTPSPSHEVGIPLPPSTSLPATLGAMSRPLPQQPQVMYPQQVSGSYSIPSSSSLQQPINSFNTPQTGNAVLSASSLYQPPPPPPPIQYSANQSSNQMFTSDGHSVDGLPPPPPPPPLQVFPGVSPQRQASFPSISNGQHPATAPPTPPPPPPQNRARRHSALPPPPVMYQQPQSVYQPPLPPPPPPPDFIGQTPLPPQPQIPYHPGPPPNLPRSEGLGQWVSGQPSPTRYILHSP